MTDTAAGDPEAIRAVVVLTDGQANAGEIDLDDIIRMISRNEVAVPQYRGFGGDSTTRDMAGNSVSRKDIIGSGLAVPTQHPIQVFFIGIGDADMEIGRMLAQATGAEFQGVADKDLAKLLEQFSKYF